jgi:beta-glucosidase
MANAKHFVNNNQETDRTLIDENVDERTRFEMYYPPFEGAIEAGVGSFMCSYNKVNGIYSCGNNSTLNTDLRDRLGFKGYVMSDWGATHTMALEQGLDQEMDGYTPNLIYTEDAVKKAPSDVLDEAVYRILWASIKTGIFDASPE